MSSTPADSSALPAVVDTSRLRALREAGLLEGVGEPRVTAVGETTLVEKGRVRASSSPSGTTFRIVLPRLPA